MTKEGSSVQSHAGTSVRRGQEETFVSTEGRGRETHLRHRNKLLTLCFSGSTIFKQIKNKGRGNREQLVTFKNLKSRMLLATKKAKVQFKIKLKGKQVQQQGRV